MIFAAVFTMYAVLSASAVSLTYDGVGYSASEPLFIENGVTYVSARALINMRSDADAVWNGTVARFNMNGLELSARVGEMYINANGENITLASPIRLVSGRVCVPVRSLAAALGADVAYDAGSSHVTLTTKANYINKSVAYSEDDLYWMSRIIHAESCGEPYIGKLLVGEVVLNRKRSAEFPSTVYGVIFDTKNGVQFTPIANGSIYQTPCGECTQAAKAVLSGAQRLANALYFVNTSLVPVSWVSENRPVIVKHGNHTFFA